MNILFFQNCVSPHQMPYIKELCLMPDVDNVIVVSPVDSLEERKDMGWEDSVKTNHHSSSGVEMIISPSIDKVKRLFEKYNNTDTWCMFSGINAFPEVSAWFVLSLGYNVKRGIITEPPYIYEHPLWQHAIRFAIKDWKYTKYIDKFFVMGDKYVWYYKLWSKKWEVIPFMYCTEWRERTCGEHNDDKLKLLYVGALSHRKNVAELLKAISLLPNEKQKFIDVGIVGDGEKRAELESMTQKENYCSATTFYGSQKMDVIPDIMQRYDVLVLPSLHDGWGAVVNEALTLGLYVICSDNCGAKYLLNNDQIGKIYKSGDAHELSEYINRSTTSSYIKEGVLERIEWAKEHISGEAIADYFINCLRKQS